MDWRYKNRPKKRRHVRWEPRNLNGKAVCEIEGDVTSQREGMEIEKSVYSGDIFSTEEVDWIEGQK